jgi:hypothetical protein
MNGSLLADSYNISNKWKNFLSLGILLRRQVYASETLVGLADPTSFKAEK